MTSLINGIVKAVPGRKALPFAFRPVASGCHGTNLPMAGNSTTFKVMKLGRAGVQRFKAVMPLFHINQSTAKEELNTGTGTFKVAINYPLGSGSWYEFRFGGNVAGTQPAGVPVYSSDILDIGFVMPARAFFGVMTEAKWAGGDGSVFNALSTGRGEWVASGNTDYFTGKTAPGSPSAGAGYAPIIIGETYEPGLGIAGDSKTEGQNASQFGDANGNRSWSERWAGEVLQIGYVNCGLNGDSAIDFSGDNAMRMALFNACGCSHGLLNHAVNDLLAVSGTIATQTADRIRLNVRAMRRAGILKVIVSKTAGRADLLVGGGGVGLANQKPYNANFGPEPSQWSALNAIIGTMTPGTDWVDMVIDGELAWCNVAPDDYRWREGTTVDLVHPGEADHTAIANLLPGYDSLP